MNEEKFKVRDFRNKGFFMIDDVYLNGWAKRLKPTATAVYISLCRHADKEQFCFPLQSLIAKQHSISRPSVQRAIKKLVEFNIVRCEQQRSLRGKFKRNVYYLLDKSEWEKETVHQKPTTVIRASKTTTSVHQKQLNKDTHYKDTQLIPLRRDAGFENMKTLIEKHDNHVLEASAIPQKKIGGATYAWQDAAVRWWKKLGLSGSPATGWFKIFKTNTVLAERACSWTSDSGGRDPEKLAYWAFAQFKKNGRIVYAPKT